MALYFSDNRLCPECGCETHVTGGYFEDNQGYIRRRKCKVCNKIYKTVERLEEEMDVEAVNLVNMRKKANIAKTIRTIDELTNMLKEANYLLKEVK